MRPSLVVPSFVIPFLAPVITYFHFPSPYAIPGGLHSRKDGVSHIQEKRVTDGRTDGWTDRRTDGPTDGPTNGRTDPHIEMEGRI